MDEGAYVRINSRRIPALLQLDPVFGAKRSGGNGVTNESRVAEESLPGAEVLGELDWR